MRLESPIPKRTLRLQLPEGNTTVQMIRRFSPENPGQTPVPLLGQQMSSLPLLWTGGAHLWTRLAFRLTGKKNTRKVRNHGSKPTACLFPPLCSTAFTDQDRDLAKEGDRGRLDFLLGNRLPT